MISSVPSSVILRISLISSILSGSEKIFRSIKEMSFSSNHALALRQDVQLGEVYNVTIPQSHSLIIKIMIPVNLRNTFTSFHFQTSLFENYMVNYIKSEHF